MTRYFHFLSFIFCLYSTSLVATDSTKVKPKIIDSNSQYFEGKIVYEHRILNPNSGLISDEEFYESIPNGGISTMTMYIKGNKYKIEDAEKTQIYQPLNNTVEIYSKKDSVYLAPANVTEDPVVSSEKMETTMNILGHQCQAIGIQTKWETRVYMYSATQLKTNPYYWKSHQRDYVNLYAGKTGNFPLLIRQKSSLGNYEMKAKSIQKMKLEDAVFEYSPKK